MIEIRADVRQEDIDRFFIEDPKLVITGLSDEEIALLFKTGQYKMSKGTHHRAVMYYNKMVALIKWDMFTCNTINLHVYISTRMQRNRKLVEIMKKISDFVYSLPIIKVIIMIPSTCKHVIKFAKKFGYEEEGRITGCYMWRQRIVDILIYGHKVGI